VYTIADIDCGFERVSDAEKSCVEIQLQIHGFGRRNKGGVAEINRIG